MLLTILALITLVVMAALTWFLHRVPEAPLCPRCGAATTIGVVGAMGGMGATGATGAGRAVGGGRERSEGADGVASAGSVAFAVGRGRAGSGLVTGDGLRWGLERRVGRWLDRVAARRVCDACGWAGRQRGAVAPYAVRRRDARSESESRR